MLLGQVAAARGLLLVRGETLGADWFLDAKNKNTLDWSVEFSVIQQGCWINAAPEVLKDVEGWGLSKVIQPSFEDFPKATE